MRKTFLAMLWKNLMVVAAMSLLIAGLCAAVLRGERARRETEIASALGSGLARLESQMTSVQSAVYLAHDNENIMELMKLHKLKTPLDYLRMRKAQDFVSSIAFANAYARDIVLSLRDAGVLLTRYASFDTLADFANHYAKACADAIAPLSFEGIKAATGFQKTSYYSAFDREERPAFIYYFSVSATAGSNDLMAYIIYDSQKAVDSLLPPNEAASGVFSLCTAGGEELLSSGEAGSQAESVSVSAESRFFSATLSLPPVWFNEQIRPMTRLTVSFAAAAAALGALLSVLAAYRQARPVMQLLQADEEKSRRGHEELTFVREEILRMNNQRSDVLAQLSAAHEALEQTMLDRLLFSKDLNARELKQALRYLPDFPMRYIVGFGVVQEGETATRQAAFLNAVCTRLPKGALFHRLDDGSFALVLSLKEGEALDGAVRLMNEILAGFHFGGTPPVRVALSMPVAGAENAAAALSSARRAFFVKKDEDEAVTADAFEAKGGVTLQDYIALYRAVISGGSERAAELVRQIFERAEIDMETVYYTLRAVLMMAERDGLHVHHASAPAHPRRLQEQLLALTEFAREIAERVNEEKKSHNDELKTGILNYISACYADSELYAQTLAQRFKISEKYLYSFIKEQTGMSLGDYLMDLRLREACRLLKESELAVGQIGAQVGFVSQNTFYKAFKRQFALSPTEFRQREKN